MSVIFIYWTSVRVKYLADAIGRRYMLIFVSSSFQFLKLDFRKQWNIDKKIITTIQALKI